MEYLKKFLFLLNKKEKKKLYILLTLILTSALLDMIGIASILPFMAVIANPDIIETNYFLNGMFHLSSKIGVKNYQEFIFLIGFSTFVLLIFSLLVKAITKYFQVSFVQMRQYSIGKRIVEGYLNKPYSWFLNQHSADLGKTILSEVGRVVGVGMNSFLELITRSMIIILIILLLILASSKLAIITGLTFGLSYGLIFKFVRKYVKKIGEESLKKNELRFVAIIEAFGAAKEVKIGGLEKIYTERFSNPQKILAKNTAINAAISQLPKYVLEAMAFGGIILLILYLMTKTGSINNALPMLSLYVLAGYRLMPAMQQIYSSFTQLIFIKPSLDKLYYDVKNFNTNGYVEKNETLTFNKQITLNNITYNYPNAKKTALRDINLTITSKTKVGFVGATGSGKTTTVDIILGLLQSQKGTLEIDGKIITKENVRSWQRLIGYVPQQIYLADDTVSANIAFGTDPKNINQEIVEKVSKISNLHNFVIEELPEKYNTSIGERGVRLSGGQRQRIGIARALYHNPKILILDEATSALDNDTEQMVMEAINNIGKDITIIIIAHRLNTVQNCDIIYKFENGKIIGKGSYRNLITKKDN